MLGNIKRSLGIVPFSFEGNRISRGMRLVLNDVIGIDELSTECVELKSHGGRIKIIGERLGISVYESRAVEIRGKIGGILLNYDKNK